MSDLYVAGVLIWFAANMISALAIMIPDRLTTKIVLWFWGIELAGFFIWRVFFT